MQPMFRYVYVFLLAHVFVHAQDGQPMSFSQIENGLRNNWISSIAQDAMGFIWVGTQDGLHRYDGYRFDVLRYSPEDPKSLAANWIPDIEIDANDDFWLAANGGGITKFSPKHMDFVNFSQNVKNRYSGKYVTEVARFGDHHVVACSEEGFSLFDIDTNFHKNLGIGFLRAPMTSNKELLWLTDRPNELFSYSLRAQVLRPEYTFAEPIQLLEYIPKLGLLVSLPNKLLLLNAGRIVKEIALDETLVMLTHDDKGNYFMASPSSLVKFDPDRFEVEKVNVDLDVSKLNILTIFLDRQGSLWVGSDKGLFKEKKYDKAFIPSHKKLHGRRILKHKDNLYVGGNDGLFSCKEKQGTNLISSVPISGLIHRRDTLIVSSANGKVYKFSNDNLVKTISVAEGEGKILSIYGLAEDRNQKLWVGAWKGVYVFDRNDRLLKFIPLNTESSIGEAKITNLYIDSKDVLWITTSAYGIYRIENISNRNLETVSTDIVKYVSEIGNKRSLTSNIVMSLEEDSDGQMWFGTDIGAVKYEDTTDDFSRLQYQGGLFDRKIMAIRNDDKDNLWITTINDGIYVYNKNEGTFRHFTEKDGLLSNAFLFGSGFFDETEKLLYFGTDEGIQKVDVSRPFADIGGNAPMITAVHVNDAEGKGIIESSQAPFLKKISLSHFQNDFSVSFSAMDFKNPEKIHYAYTLDDANWKITDLQTAYFTNVPYGHHELKVNAIYDGMATNQKISTLEIFIRPPWYYGKLAKGIYFLLLAAAAWGVYCYLKWRWKMKFDLQLKIEEAERFKKLNEVKSRMYTDIAHEFKTPLTLIAGPIDKKLGQADVSKEDRSDFSMVRRNANRMTSLVDQLLQLAKLENGKLQLKVNSGDLSLFLNSLSKPFEYQAQLKQIAYEVDIGPRVRGWYDEDIVEKVVSNLLSNAFKYTPDQGKCRFIAKKDGDALRISIKNTVLNRQELELDKLFIRFYQRNSYSEGMGVGLALVKELVNFYGGSVNAEWEDEETICFNVRLPIDRDAFKAEDRKGKSLHKDTRAPEPIDHEAVNEEHIEDETLPILLIVEDHAEIRAFIKQSLRQEYQILEAEDGKRGLEMALAHIPDIVLSDIRMPFRSGIELCHRLKTDKRTSHIPIVLLTASTSEENELKGLASGADDFVTKPFKVKILRKRLANLIQLRKMLRDRYGREFVLKPKKISVSPADEVLLTKFQQILDEHLSDPAFNATEFSKKAGMSRMQLHRKILAFTGLTTSAFIRSQRLKQAEQLLQASDLTINEVAYATGFNTPTYFMKCFKKTFKKTPSGYLQSLSA